MFDNNNTAAPTASVTTPNANLNAATAPDAVQPTAFTATANWMDRVPIELRLTAAEAAILKAPAAVPGKAGEPTVLNVACDLVMGCGLPPADALSMLQEYNLASCSGTWTLDVLDRQIAEAVELLQASPANTLGHELAPYAAEVLDALGLNVAVSDAQFVLCKGERKRKFTPATQLKVLERQFAQNLHVLFPEIPEKVVKAAAAALALEPVQPDATEEAKDVFEIASDALSGMPSEIVQEAAEALRDPELLDRLVQHVQVLGFHAKGIEDQVKAVILGQACRLAKQCSLVTVRGDPGTGRSQLVASCCETLPPEFLRTFSRISPKALVRRGQFDLQYVVVRCGERLRNDGNGDGNATSFLRQFVSDGFLSYEVVGNDKDPSKCLSLRVDGPTAFLETTTSECIFSEDESRMLSVWLSLSITEKQSVLRTMLEGAQGLHATPDGVEHTRQLSWAIHRQLQPRNVTLPVGPEAEKLMELGDIRSSDAGRRMNLAIAMVKAHAILYQYQRESDANGNLMATPGDIDAVIRIFKSLKRAQLLAKQEVVTYRVAQAYATFLHEPFEASQLAELCDVDPHTANGWLKHWKKAGFVEVEKEAAGSAAAKYRMTTSAATTVDLGAAA